MRKRILQAIIAGIAATLLSGLYAQQFNWPDFQHIDYGWPLAWLTRTLSTIIGPTDRISLNKSALFVDWLIYSAAAFAVLFAIQRGRGHK